MTLVLFSSAFAGFSPWAAG